MSAFPHARPASSAGAVLGLAWLVALTGPAHGQSDLIGSRGGLTVPTVPTLPVLPPTLNLPPAATTSLLNGLNASGTALRPGMGWLVSDLTHQGIHGPQLADVIHQLKPYKQQGVLTFPQNIPQTGTPFPVPGFPQPPATFPGQGWDGHGHPMPGFHRGGGKGGGKGGRG
jgi:hypothetical protein